MGRKTDMTALEEKILKAQDEVVKVKIFLTKEMH